MSIMSKIRRSKRAGTIRPLPYRSPSGDEFDPKQISCPRCGAGKVGIDSLCDRCWRDYLGTHMGGRSED
jgi:hypothetical protein